MNGQRFQLLSLSGGGYRGIYTAAVLAALERDLGRPIGQCFDLIAGTSIGGIIALAVAFEIDMAKVAQTFKDAGPSSFPFRSNRGVIRKWLNLISDFQRPPYSASPIRQVVNALLGSGTKLGDAKHPLLIPTVNLTAGRPQVFKTPHHVNFVRDKQLEVIDIALATSAAPTFFAPARFNDCLYADGGLVANSPDLIALHEATHFLQCPRERIWMLSIGTTTTKYSVADVASHSYGIGFWVAEHERRLPNVLISAQQQFAEQITEHVLQDRYVRIDTVPSHEQAAHLGLDVATPTATTTLFGLGEKAGSDALGNARVRALLTHQPCRLLP